MFLTDLLHIVGRIKISLTLNVLILSPVDGAFF
jgi:hypothetical protein